MVANLKEPVPNLDTFHAVVDRHADRWFSVCLNITRNPALAEDAVQDGLITAWRKREQFHGDAKLETWIHRIVVNAALQLLRKYKPQAWQPLEEDKAIEQLTPVDARAEQEMGIELAVALNELSEFERVCFMLKHIEQWRLKEIAEELDTAVSNIKQGLFRAVRKLRVGMADWRRENHG